MAALRVAVVDYGAGNMVSIGRALEAVGSAATIVDRPEGLDPADLLVVPGVGAAAPAMARLADRDLVEPIRAWIRDGRPFLGICLGLQLLYEGSDEDGAATLGVLGGRTVPLLDAPTLPHIGWNQVVRRRPHPVLDGVRDGADMYFVHSYVAAPADPMTVVADTTHGATFPSIVALGALTGVQFHPERSGTDGLRILANVVALAASPGRPAVANPGLAPLGAG